MTEAATRHGYAGHIRGTPCWASLMAYGLAEAQDFYHKLFGWEFRSGSQRLGPYVRCLVDGREVAGMGEMAEGRHLRVAWMPYLASENADRTAGLIRERGGTVAVGPLDADEAGRMVIASDTTGAVFGVWQAGQHLGLGTAEAGAPGTPVWYELITHESGAAARFYTAVFGYDTKPVGQAGADQSDFDYLTLRLAGEPVAGVHGVGSDLPRGRGPHWNTYFAVQDTDATADGVRELGGRLMRPPHDSPYGRVATVADPEGAEFSVIQTGRRTANGAG